MNAHLVTLVLVLALLGSAVPVTATDRVVVGRADLSLSVPDNRVEPGEETTVDVFVVNDATIVRGGPQVFVDRVTTARATTLDIGTVRGVDIETDEIPFGVVPEGVHGPASIEVTVPESTPPGTYRLPATLTYTYTTAVAYDRSNVDAEPEYEEATVTERVTIPIVVEERARFRVVEMDTDAQIGGSGTMTVSVRNAGTATAREASVRVTSANEDLRFGEASTAESFVGDWHPGETKTATVPVAVAGDAERRDYTITGQVSYTDADGLARSSKVFRSSVRPLAEQAFSLSTVDGTLRVDAEGTVTGTVTNDGPLTATDAVVVFRPVSPNFDVGETEFAVPNLAPGESAPFSFDVEVSSAADPGSRQLRFVVEYRTEDGDERTSDTLPARIEVAPERDVVAVERVDATVPAGGSGRLTLRVTNVDTEALSDISAKLFVDDPLSTSDDEAYVGHLAPGETAEISFEMTAAGSAFPKDYPVSIDFEYDRPDGTTELTDTFRLPVTVEERRRGTLPFGVLAVVGAAILVGAGSVVWRRR